MASEAVTPSPAPLREDIVRLVHELRGMAYDHLELATLETRLTINTAIRMAAIAVVTAAMVISAWLAILGAAALGLINLGLAPVTAMLLLAALNLLVAFLGWRSLRNKTASLGWPATQRLVKPLTGAGRDEAGK